jgi:8-oxo-dGTP pyrophosphatase MutT (NUDIX family)
MVNLPPLSCDLLNQLDLYTTIHSDELQMLEAMRGFARDYPDCFDRSLKLGHVTGSAWIIDEEGRSALLTFHRRLNRWLQLGGHWEGDPSVFVTADREAREESGLTSLVPLSNQIFDIDIHRIPKRHPEPEHLHYDVRFIFKADKTERLTVSSESRDLAWVPMEQIIAYGDRSLARMVEKTARFR